MLRYANVIERCGGRFGIGPASDYPNLRPRGDVLALFGDLQIDPGERVGEVDLLADSAALRDFDALKDEFTLELHALVRRHVDHAEVVDPWIDRGDLPGRTEGDRDSELHARPGPIEVHRRAIIDRLTKVVRLDTNPGELQIELDLSVGPLHPALDHEVGVPLLGLPIALVDEHGARTVGPGSQHRALVGGALPSRARQLWVILALPNRQPHIRAHVRRGLPGRLFRTETHGQEANGGVQHDLVPSDLSGHDLEPGEGAFVLAASFALGVGHAGGVRSGREGEILVALSLRGAAGALDPDLHLVVDGAIGVEDI